MKQAEFIGESSQYRRHRSCAFCRPLQEFSNRDNLSRFHFSFVPRWFSTFYLKSNPAKAEPQKPAGEPPWYWDAPRHRDAMVWRLYGKNRLYLFGFFRFLPSAFRFSARLESGRRSLKKAEWPFFSLFYRNLLFLSIILRRWKLSEKILKIFAKKVAF